MWDNAGLIGDTGFVGGALLREITFSKTYNSRTIENIAGEAFDILVCAGAPATMWAANSSPQRDLKNLNRLEMSIAEARFNRLVLVSTIAVYDDVSAGYTENNARYDANNAYGRNRRELELHLLQRYNVNIVRLGALFGKGLKKNFIFDLMNPIPSFIRIDKFEQLSSLLSQEEMDFLNRIFDLNHLINMYKLDRNKLNKSGRRLEMEGVFERIGFLATSFTNSDSQYQYYDIDNLKRDMEIGLSNNLQVVNICSEPWRIGELHMAILGRPFTNEGPPVVKENVHTDYASIFGGKGNYIYDRSVVLDGLRKFVSKG